MANVFAFHTLVRADTGVTSLSLLTKTERESIPEVKELFVIELNKAKPESETQPRNTSLNQNLLVLVYAS